MLRNWGCCRGLKKSMSSHRGRHAHLYMNPPLLLTNCQWELGQVIQWLCLNFLFFKMGRMIAYISWGFSEKYVGACINMNTGQGHNRHLVRVNITTHPTTCRFLPRCASSFWLFIIIFKIIYPLPSPHGSGIGADLLLVLCFLCLVSLLSQCTGLFISLNHIIGP